jgi:hypothetical protein
MELEVETLTGATMAPVVRIASRTATAIASATGIPADARHRRRHGTVTYERPAAETSVARLMEIVRREYRARRSA